MKSAFFERTAQHFKFKMEAAAGMSVRRSHSLDLGKPAKFDFGPDRNRNDSGCFDDFEPSMAGHHDPVVTYWEEAVYQWSDRAR